MQTDIPDLFVEINYSNYIFVVGIYDDSQNFKIIEKIIMPNEGINKNKFININQAQEVIKKNVQAIEDKLNYVFKDVTIILDNFYYSCINISGFKKLNGSQVLKENISYILNSVKLAVTENKKEKTILHIFNSKSVLDGTRVENLPIGLFGDFYSHELTFFLINNNDLKNIKQVFNKNNLNVKKVLIKNFIEGAQLIDQNNNTETFFKIKINKDGSNLSFFDKSSFRYVEHFNFGTSIIFKDIMKVCSIDHEIIERILSDKSYENKSFEDNELLEEKYFAQRNYRKIRKKLIMDIVNARIEEIASIILNKNISIESFKKNNIPIYMIIEDELIFNNFKENFKSYFSQDYNFDIHLIDDFKINELIMSASRLSIYGWKKEAIPVTQTKNSLITRIFKSLFG
jgi:cell division protein FtsA